MTTVSHRGIGGPLKVVTSDPSLIAQLEAVGPTSREHAKRESAGPRGQVWWISLGLARDLKLVEDPR